MNLKKVCCIGADRIGGAFGTILAYKCPDVLVHVLDLDEEKIKQWNSSELPFYGNDFADFIKKCRDENLFFTTKAMQALRDADIIFICKNSQMKNLGMGKGRTMDMKPIEDAARLIGKVAKPHQIVVEKSTIPIRAAETVSTILKTSTERSNFEKDKKEFVVLSNPDFLFEETLINDLLFPERVLIGGDTTPASKAAIETVASLYENWVPKEKIISSDTWSAELAKLSVNSLLAQRISSVTSLSEVCEATHADVSEVALALGMNSKIASKDLTVSLGFGGPSLPKDILNMVYLCETLNLPQLTAYWQKVIDFNEYHQKRFTKIIIDAFFNTIKDKSIAILGFAFKKNTDNTTDSPALQVCKTLLQEGAHLKIYDPAVSEAQIWKDLRESCKLEEKLLEKMVAVAVDPYEATEGTHGVVICTDWEEFENIDFYRVFKNMMKPAYIFDGWKILPHERLVELGFNVRTVGKNLDPNFAPPADGN